MKQLAILIPTLPIRIDGYTRLIKKLNQQIIQNNLTDKIQIISFCDTKDVTVGVKRNWLLEKSNSKYVCFLDDDDDISNNYIKSLYEATLQGADCVTFLGEHHDNGKITDFSISTMHSRNYNDTNCFYRLPNHLCPVKREIAIACMFTDKNFGEDSDYAEKINRVIKNEFHIKEKLYFYLFNSVLSQTAPTSQVSQFN
jgi:glycosyltransferase involved in cell wall biosynthesis